MVKSGKVHTFFIRYLMRVLFLAMLSTCITACGSENQAEEVMQPSVERIPQDELEDADRQDGVTGGRDALTLTIEAMQEDGKDTSLVEGKIVTKGLKFEIPEGFFESKDVPGMYVTKRYPLDAANICYLEKEADPVMQYMTKEDYEEIVLKNLGLLQEEKAADEDEGRSEQTEQEPVKDGDGTIEDFKITEFKERSFDGIPGFRVKSTYTYNELTISQTEYIVNADKTYILTYTMTNEYDRSAWFAASENSIHIKK